MNAEYQHIIYNEWLPAVLGKQFMATYGLFPLGSGYSNDYDTSFDPRITNEFAAAAFRFGHSLIPDVFKRVPQSGTVGGQQGRTAALSMKDVFFKPDALRTNGGELICVMLLPLPADSACWRRLTMVAGARRGKRKQNPFPFLYLFLLSPQLCSMSSSEEWFHRRVSYGTTLSCPRFATTSSRAALTTGASVRRLYI